MKNKITKYLNIFFYVSLKAIGGYLIFFAMTSRDPKMMTIVLRPWMIIMFGVGLLFAQIRLGNNISKEN